MADCGVKAGEQKPPLTPIAVRRPVASSAVITRWLWQLLPHILVVAATLLIWEWAVRMYQSSLVPAPSTALSALCDLFGRGVLMEDLVESLRRVLSGFAAAASAGIVLGLVLGASSRLRLAAFPLIEVLRPIPPIAWIPLSMTIFGLGDASACFVIFIGAFYPVLTNTILGVREVPQLFIEAAKLLGCTTAQRFTKVIWPASLPSIFAGLKVGLGFAWMCVVAAEMIAARSGLGYEIQLNRQLLRLDRVVAGMIVIGITGLLMNWLLSRMEKRLLPWRGQVIDPRADDDRPDVVRSKAVFSPIEFKDGASIQLDGVSFAHESTRRVLEGLTLEVPKGEILCILGPSGCGKTTLLRLIAGLARPTSGNILVEGQELHEHSEEITMVFQNSALFPWRTAEGNVRFALESRQSVGGGDLTKKSIEYLRLVGLEKKSHHYPQQLSGGQRQRVALARALAYSPRILLLDEPFASLDSQTRENLQEELWALLKARGITAVFVTHDIREAIFLADRVCVLSGEGGRVLAVHKIDQTLPREESFRYTSEFSASRLYLWNLLKDAK